MLAGPGLLCLLFFLMAECAAALYGPALGLLFCCIALFTDALFRLFSFLHSSNYTVNLYLKLLLTTAITPLHIQPGVCCLREPTAVKNVDMGAPIRSIFPEVHA